MSELSPALQAHLDGAATTICHCWLVVRRDGVVLGFTDHDRPLMVGGVLHEPQTGFTASEARDTIGLGADATDVEGALSSDQISEADIAAGRYDGAAVETWLVNWSDPSQAALIRRSTFGAITRADGRFKVELEGLAAALDRPMGRVFSKMCDAELGDARCGFDIGQAGFHGAGAVTGTRGRNVIAASGLGAFANGWFDNGLLTWTSGTAEGTVQRIMSHRAGVAGDVELGIQGELPENAYGLTFTLVAGCDRRFTTCKAKFANSLNFRGFPHMPGNDAAYAYVRDGDIFDGGALVP